ncbi:MAG: hypothetical protein GY755_04555 [Chloroflexi bacterium]|nr:hypothetical protein [Chloroflexota bacterium]
MTYNGYVREITEEEKARMELQSCKDMLYSSELIGCHESQITYWKNRIENANTKLSVFSSGNPESEAGKAIIADAVEVKERMWHVHAMRDHTCYDNGLTSEPCHACEAQELSENSEMVF